MGTSKFKKIWNNKEKIYEGLKNTIFKKQYVEDISAARMELCRKCLHIDLEGSRCEVPGTNPCCGLCGCSLALKTRSLSSDCADEDNIQWHAVLTQEQEDQLNNQLNTDEYGNSIHSSGS